MVIYIWLYIYMGMKVYPDDKILKNYIIHITIQLLGTPHDLKSPYIFKIIEL